MPETPPRLDVTLRHTQGALPLDVHFKLEKDWTVLFAPSGAGKTTLLRLIAGLVRPQSGHVALLDTILTDTARRIFVPPHLRGIRLVSQQPALFPHLTVRENVAYGAGSSTRATEIPALCRIEHLMEKRSPQLSGGERQRVALARALSAQPAHVLLLDEPFTGLEVDLRDRISQDLKQWLKKNGIPALHATHNVGEIFSSADEVIRLESGQVAAQGTPTEVLKTERLRLLAQLAD